MIKRFVTRQKNNCYKTFVDETFATGRNDNNFESLAISKIGYLALPILITNSVLEELKQIQKLFLRRNKRAKIKHDTLCNNSTEDGLKSVDIKHKFWH